MRHGVGPGRNGLSLQCLQERKRAGAHLGGHHASQVLLQVDDVDRGNPSHARPQLKLAANGFRSDPHGIRVDRNDAHPGPGQRRSAFALHDHPARGGRAWPLVAESRLPQPARQCLRLLARAGKRHNPTQFVASAGHNALETRRIQPRQHRIRILFERPHLGRRPTFQRVRRDRPPQQDGPVASGAHVASPRLREHRLLLSLQQHPHQWEPDVRLLGHRSCRDRHRQRRGFNQARDRCRGLRRAGRRRLLLGRLWRDDGRADSAATQEQRAGQHPGWACRPNCGACQGRLPPCPLPRAQPLRDPVGQALDVRRRPCRRRSESRIGCDRTGE